MIEIDGSYGEGGGQLTRYALILSTLTRKPVHIYNIRQGREKPGLKQQHMYAIKTLEKIADAKAENVHLGSNEIRYNPGEIKGGKIKIDIGTAGSITLLIQNILIPTLYAEKQTRLTVIGGTDVTWSPQIDYLDNLIIRFFRHYSKNIHLNIIKRGYYPKGNGKVELTVTPKELDLKPINLTQQPKIEEILGISHCSESLKKPQVADRQANMAKSLLSNYKTKIKREYCNTLSDGSGITLWAKDSFLGSDSLGKRGKRAEIVAQEASEALLKEINSGAAVDKHLADNVIPFLALTTGSIKTSEITNHTKTAIWITEQFLPVKFDIKDNIISCK